MKINSKQNVINILNKLKEFLNIKTDDELANVLGVTAPTISNWRRRGTISYDIIFEKIENLDYNWLLYNEEVENTNDYSTIKAKENKLKDANIEYVNNSELEEILNIEVYDVPAYMSETGLVNMEEYPHSTKKLYIGMKIDPKHLKAVRVIGNSMEGSGINNNDHVIYRIDDKAYNNRQILANLNGALIVKTLRKEKNGIVLYSEYSDQSKPIPVCEDDNLNIIGIVVAVISYR